MGGALMTSSGKSREDYEWLIVVELASDYDTLNRYLGQNHCCFLPAGGKARTMDWPDHVNQLHNRCIRMGTHRLADKEANCIGGDDSGDNIRGYDSGGFETRPYGAVRYHNNITKRDYSDGVWRN